MLVLYSPGLCTELPIDAVLSTANGGKGSTTFGALGDGDVGGFKSSYLKTLDVQNLWEIKEIQLCDAKTLSIQSFFIHQGS